MFIQFNTQIHAHFSNFFFFTFIAHSLALYCGRSWDAFQECVSGVLSGCRGDAAEVWESLRAESRRTQFSGNLYEMCASRPQATTLNTLLTPTRTDQTNQESLKGLAESGYHTHPSHLLLASILLILVR